MKVYHFHNGSGGGVLSVIRNLINFSTNPSIENHVIYTINEIETGDYTPEKITGSLTQQVFYYNSKNNFYHTCRQLAKLLPDNKAIIVAHDWLELGMVSNLGLQNTVVQMLHGNYDYYYNLAIKNKNSIDYFLCVADVIRKKLNERLSGSCKNIYAVSLPIAKITSNKEKRKPSKILFLGRCELNKGYNKLPLIAEKLAGLNKDFQWHIIGSGSLDSEKQNQWHKEINVTFYGDLPLQKVHSLLPTFDFIILPSLAEGMPVSIIEAMKAGIVPLVNDLEGGVQQIIENGENGFRITDNNYLQYADILIELQDKLDLFDKLSKKATSFANLHFNPIDNTAAIEKIIYDASLQSNVKKRSKVYGSYLDEPWIPNFLVLFIRFLIAGFKKA